MTTRHAITPDEAKGIATWVEGLELPFTLTVTEGKVRSLNANALFHKWLAVIAHFKGDRTPTDVKGEMHRKHGLSIRLRNPQFAWVWDKTGAHLPYEKQCSVLASGVFSISSGMTTKELKEYMDAIEQDCAEQGISLPQPEDRK